MWPEDRVCNGRHRAANEGRNWPIESAIQSQCVCRRCWWQNAAHERQSWTIPWNWCPFVQFSNVFCFTMPAQRHVRWRLSRRRRVKWKVTAQRVFSPRRCSESLLPKPLPTHGIADGKKIIQYALRLPKTAPLDLVCVWSSDMWYVSLFIVISCGMFAVQFLSCMPCGCTTCWGQQVRCQVPFDWGYSVLWQEAIQELVQHSSKPQNQKQSC